MPSSLDKLAGDFDDEECRKLRYFYRGDDYFKLMTQKGVYTYEYMDGWQKFEETKLPPKEAFYSKLNKRGISDGD